MLHNRIGIVLLCCILIHCGTHSKLSSNDNNTVPDTASSDETNTHDETIQESYQYEASDNQIYHNGNLIHLFGLNWFGFETSNHVFHGLWEKNYKDLLDIIQDLNFNALRIPVCPDTLHSTTTSSINTSKNPTLDGLNSLEVLDIMLEELESRHIYFLLDMHRIECDTTTELWHNDNYSHEDWIEDLVFMSSRYKNLEYFLGVDLFNEPHESATWGDGNEDTDWKLAAEDAAEEILAINDNILIFVEGIHESDLCSSTEYGHWWGGNLEPQNCYPLDINSSKLVLSPHVYGPDVYWQSYFSDTNFSDNMPDIWDEHFGFLNEVFVVVPGEFGGKYGDGLTEDITWQNEIIDYFINNNMCSFFYWGLNPNSSDTGGILDDDWETVKQEKYNNLNRLMEYCD